MDRLPLQELLGRLYRRFSEEFEREMRAAGFGDVTLAHGTNVLRFLDDDGVRIGVLAELSGLSKQALSQQVKFLEARGYVAVEPDPSDSRAKLVRNTDRGLECRAVARPLFRDIEAGWSRRIGRTGVQGLRAAMERAVAAFAEPD